MNCFSDADIEEGRERVRKDAVTVAAEIVVNGGGTSEVGGLLAGVTCKYSYLDALL